MRLDETTPKDSLSWYIKWLSSSFLIAAMAIRASDGSNFIDTLLSFTGAFGWFCVACLWKDRALITLNAIGMFILFSGLLQGFV